jgi:hypothetical protein
VVFKSKLTHHLTQFLGGSWVVGKKSYGRFATLEEVCGPVILPQSVLTRLQCIPSVPVMSTHAPTTHFSITPACGCIARESRRLACATPESCATRRDCRWIVAAPTHEQRNRRRYNLFDSLGLHTCTDCTFHSNAIADAFTQSNTHCICSASRQQTEWPLYRTQPRWGESSRVCSLDQLQKQANPPPCLD